MLYLYIAFSTLISITNGHSSSLATLCPDIRPGISIVVIPLFFLVSYDLHKMPPGLLSIHVEPLLQLDQQALYVDFAAVLDN